MNAFRLSDPETKPRNKKIFNEINSKSSTEYKERKLKVFPEKTYSNIMAKIISHNVKCEDLKESGEKKVKENY